MGAEVDHHRFQFLGEDAAFRGARVEGPQAAAAVADFGAAGGRDRADDAAV
jgi:hypothetical protein